jgi:hypothetical protein
MERCHSRTRTGIASLLDMTRRGWHKVRLNPAHGILVR